MSSYGVYDLLLTIVTIVVIVKFFPYITENTSINSIVDLIFQSEE